MITNRQKGLVHLYANACHLAEFEYRALLRRYSGCASCADPEMHQDHFDLIMPALEVRLEQAIDRGEVDPAKLPRAIRRITYWRDRAEVPGRINRRQLQLVEELWSQLGPVIGDLSRVYLYGIVRQACRRDVDDLARLSTAQGIFLIEALRDRLAHALPLGMEISDCLAQSLIA